MSIIGSNLLEQLIIEKKEPTPSQMLFEMDIKIVHSLKQRSGDAKLKDGMDVALCRISKDKTKLEFAGATRPLWHVRGSELTEIISPLFPIGGYYKEIEKKFRDTAIDLKPGDWIYLASDGFADQFGGPGNKRYSAKRFKDFLLSLSAYSSQDQLLKLKKELKEWRGESVQVDDILVAGIKI